MEYIEIDGHRMAYLRHGHGETVLLVHGITTYSFIWRKIIPLLTDHYDVIAVDLLGCGASDKPLDVSYAIKEHAERLHAFTKALAIEKLHFIGHDLGGGMGQIFAVTYPEKLYDLTMINTVAYDFWPVQPIIAMRTPVIRQLMMGACDLGAFRFFVKSGMAHKEKVSAELMELFWQPMKTPEGKKAFLHFARCLDHHNLTDISEALRQLQIPSLILRGDADPFLSAAISEKLNAEIPGCRLERIDTASHYLMEDEPEWAAERILSFIEGQHG